MKIKNELFHPKRDKDFEFLTGALNAALISLILWGALYAIYRHVRTVDEAVAAWADKVGL